MWDVVVRREVRPLIDGLAGKGVGYAAAYEQLRRDPCASIRTADGGRRPWAHRLSGGLATKVCGTHLKRGYRLAFTLNPSRDARTDGIVEVLYVGPRDTRDRTRDVWTIVHDLSVRRTRPRVIFARRAAEARSRRSTTRSSRSSWRGCAASCVVAEGGATRRRTTDQRFSSSSAAVRAAMAVQSSASARLRAASHLAWRSLAAARSSAARSESASPGS
jgi:hypothetical protein